MTYRDSPEKLTQESKKLEEAFPAYKTEIAQLSPQEREELMQAAQTHPIIKYLLLGQSFEYDLDEDGIPERIKGGIPLNQILELATELKKVDEQQEREIINQTLKAYVELKDLKEDLFLDLQSKEILRYLQGTSLFNVFVDYFEKQGATHEKAIEQTENLSKAINSIWELYLERALPPEFDRQNVKSLATGFSFGFMKWLNENPQNIEEVSNYIAKLSNQNTTELIKSGFKGLMGSKNIISFLQSSTALVRQLADNKDLLRPKVNKALKDPSIWADIVSQFLQNPKNYDPISELKKHICKPPFSQDCTKINEVHLKDIANETAKLLKQNPSMLKSMDYLANLAPVLKQVNEGIQQFKINMLTNPVWGAIINGLSDLQQMINSLNKDWGEKLKDFLDNIMFWLGFREGINSFGIEKARALQLSLKPSLTTFLNQNKENFKGTLFEKDPWAKIEEIQGNLSEYSLDFFKNLKVSIPTTTKQQINLIKQFFNLDEKKGQLTKIINQVLSIDEFKQRFNQYQFLLKSKNGKIVLDLNDLDKLLQAFLDFEKQKSKPGKIKKFEEFLIQKQTEYFMLGQSSSINEQTLTPGNDNINESPPSRIARSISTHPNIEIKENPQELLKTAAEFIKEQEGFIKRPMWDHKQRTRGYGTRVKGLPTEKNASTDEKAMSMSITEATAEKELMAYLHELYLGIKTFSTPENRKQLTDNQKVALLSFGYNVGIGNFKEAFCFLASNELPFEKIKEEIPRQMSKYIYAGGKKLKGLENRRRREIELFNKDFTG